MQAISDKYYKALTAQERVAASIEAEARGDDTELMRIKNTAPRKDYRMLETEYGDTMLQLTSVVISLEADMLAQALTHTIALRAGEYEMAEQALQTIANLEAGRNRIFCELGVSPEAADGYGPSRHPVLENLVSIAPDPNGEQDEQIQNLMDSIPAIKNRQKRNMQEV